MHYYMEQLGSKVGEGMCRDSQRVTRPHLVLAVLVLQQSPPNSLSTQAPKQWIYFGANKENPPRSNKRLWSKARKV